MPGVRAVASASAFAPVPEPVPVTVDVGDPVAVWAATKEAVGRGAAAAWLTHFSLGRLDPAQGVVELVPRPGLGGGGRSLATESRLQKLGQAMARVLGRPVRPTLGIPAVPGAGGGPEGDAAGPDAVGGGVNRRDALALPLVREALDTFPEATFLSARRCRTAAALLVSLPAGDSPSLPSD